MIMKKIIFTALLALMVSCQHKPDFDQDFHITLDGGNTYVVGEPVRFNINGNIDNILFYSGEPGSEYEHRDRYMLTKDEIKSATLTLDIQARYKGGEYNGGLDIYVTDQFDGLLWNDGQQDRTTVQSMLENGMQGWRKLEYVPGASEEWVNLECDVTGLTDNFAMAVHWHPEVGQWGKYMMNCDLVVQPVTGDQELVYDIKDMGLNVLNMPEDYKPYKSDSAVGFICFSSTEAEVGFMGSTSITYQLDSWMFSIPAPVGRLEGDTGFVVKNLQSERDFFEYRWEKSGMYKVVFVCVDYSAGEGRRIISEFNINIVEPIN
jgi:hypothetical protein